MRDLAAHAASRFALARLLLFVLFLLGIPAQNALAQNPAPFINQPVVPVTVAPGGPAFTLTINGTGFAAAATVNWNGSPRPTTFVSQSQLTAAIPTTDITAANTVSLTVVNPAPGGGTSNVVFLPVTNSEANVPLGRADMSVGDNPVAVAVGDFNGDGKLDLAVLISFQDANGGFPAAGVVSILLGDGTGGFTASATLPTGILPSAVVVGDFNGDGKLDLAVVNQCAAVTGCEQTGNGTISIFLGDGSGGFTATNASLNAGLRPVFVAVGDFNGDGNADLAVLNLTSSWGGEQAGTGTVIILLGDGTGGFTPTASPPSVGVGPFTLTVGDFNGDGKLDLAVPNYNDSTVSILLGDGTGNFNSGATLNVVKYPSTAAIADFNGDGKLDLAVSSDCSNSSCLPGSLSILLGDGTGNFTAFSSVNIGAYANSIAVGDFNGDGKLDLAVNTAPIECGSPCAGQNGNISILFGDGTGNFGNILSAASGGFGTSAIAAGDFNRDGRLDLVAVNEIDNISIFVQGAKSAPPPPPMGITVSPASLSFPAQYVGTTGLPQTVIVTNTGSQTVMISNIQLPSSYGQTNNCTNPIPLNANCSIAVFFDPTASGNNTGNLSFTDNNDPTGGPLTVALSGTGQDFNFAPAANASTVATVTAGQTATYTLALSPQGGFNQMVSLACTGAPLQSSCAVTPSSVTLNANTPTTVTISVQTTVASITAPGSLLRPPAEDLLKMLPALLFVAAFWAFATLTLAGKRFKPAPRAATVPLAVLLFASSLLLSCGGSGTPPPQNPVTPAGSYTLNVAASFASGNVSLTHNVQLTLTVR